MKLKTRRLDVCEKTPDKSGQKTVLQRFDVLRRTVGRQNNLFAVFVKRGERVEELFLRRLFSGDELNVVDQKNVGVAVMLTEPVLRPVLKTRDQIVGEILALSVDDLAVWIVPFDLGSTPRGPISAGSFRALFSPLRAHATPPAPSR